MPAATDGRFPTTQWTLISRLRSGDEDIARRALDDLCLQYHYPLYFYIRRRGLEHHDAQDVLHGFLAKLLRLESLKQAHEERGRLRGWLATALKRFLINWFRDHAASRQELSLEAEKQIAEAEGRFLRERLVDEDTPERIFERRWATELLRHVQHKLRLDYAARGKTNLFEALLPALMAGGSLRGEDAPEIADALGMSHGALRVAMTRLLKDYRVLLREEVLQTVDSPEMVDDELAHLVRVFQTV